MSPMKNYVILEDADVRCGRGAKNFVHHGNQFLRCCIDRRLGTYRQCEMRIDKTTVIHKTIEDVYRKGGRFLKFDTEAMRWYDGGLKAAKMRVGVAFRDAASLAKRIAKANAGKVKSGAARNTNAKKKYGTINLKETIETNNAKLQKGEIVTRKDSWHDGVLHKTIKMCFDTAFRDAAALVKKDQLALRQVNKGAAPSSIAKDSSVMATATNITLQGSKPNLANQSRAEQQTIQELKTLFCPLPATTDHALPLFSLAHQMAYSQGNSVKRDALNASIREKKETLRILRQNQNQNCSSSRFAARQPKRMGAPSSVTYDKQQWRLPSVQATTAHPTSLTMPFASEIHQQYHSPCKNSETDPTIPNAGLTTNLKLPEIPDEVERGKSRRSPSKTSGTYPNTAISATGVKPLAVPLEDVESDKQQRLPSNETTAEVCPNIPTSTTDLMQPPKIGKEKRQRQSSSKISAADSNAEEARRATNKRRRCGPQALSAEPDLEAESPWCDCGKPKRPPSYCQPTAAEPLPISLNGQDQRQMHHLPSAASVEPRPNEAISFADPNLLAFGADPWDPSRF